MCATACGLRLDDVARYCRVLRAEWAHKRATARWAQTDETQRHLAALEARVGHVVGFLPVGGSTAVLVLWETDANAFIGPEGAPHPDSAWHLETVVGSGERAEEA